MGTVKIRPGRRLRILDFDTESRPLTYLGSDYTTAELTAWAGAWVHEPDHVAVYVLGETSMAHMLSAWRLRYDYADIVTGHNIVRHDLPRLNAMLLELGQKPLGPKLVQDTYRDLARRNGVAASQESLAEMLGVEAPKVGMSQPAWREANRLLPQGLDRTRERVIGDVRQHLQLRDRLIHLHWLRPARLWDPLKS